MIDRRNHRELLTLWGIKNGGIRGPSIKDLSGSWNCPHCTYINTLNLHADVCMACGNVCASRRHAVKQKQLLKENLADRAAELLSQQDELLKDLDDDNESEDEKHSSIMREEAPEIMSFRSIAPVAAGMQLHLILLPDLLLDCLSFLQNPLDIMNVMLVCKLFSSVAGDDTLWWRFQSRFINDPSSDTSSEPLASPISSKSCTGSIGTNDGNSNNPLRTWVCSRCQLTQALATSTQCEMCLTDRDLSSEIEPVSSIGVTGPTGFIIVKSAEHLAALWIEGSKNYKDREEGLSGNVIVTNNSNSDSSKTGESPAINNSNRAAGEFSIKMIQNVAALDYFFFSKTLRTFYLIAVTSLCEDADDPLTHWAWHVGLPGTAFIIERSRAVHTVRSHSLTQGAGKWFYRYLGSELN